MKGGYWRGSIEESDRRPQRDGGGGTLYLLVCCVVVTSALNSPESDLASGFRLEVRLAYKGAGRARLLWMGSLL